MQDSPSRRATAADLRADVRRPGEMSAAEAMANPATSLHHQARAMACQVGQATRAYRVRQVRERRARQVRERQPRAAQRQSRPRARRTAASSSSSSADPGDDGSEPPPPRPRLWRHPRFGLCSPALLRLLVRAQAEGAQR